MRPSAHLILRPRPVGRLVRVPPVVAIAMLLAVAGDASAQMAGESIGELRALEAHGVREIIVRRDPGLDAAARVAVRDAVDATLVDRLPLPDVEVLRVPAGTLAEAVAELRAHPDVRWVEANGPVHAAAADPLWSWPLGNDGRAVHGVSGTPGADAAVREAWAHSTGAGVTVAVVDTGVDASHPDLAGRIVGNPRESGGGRETNGIDDDGNGLVDDSRGWDYVDRDANPHDGGYHGTHVAGTIAAVRDNGIGIAGVAPEATILPLRVLAADGAGWDSDVAAAFDYAGELGIPIVNASVGGWGPSPAETEAIRRHPGTLYVVASGNGGSDVDAAAYAPCTIPEPNVVCVGASDNRDQPAPFSNFGARSVDLFAPGTGITSLLTGAAPPYGSMSGTSMAAPHVAGVAALVRAARRGATPSVLRAALLDGADRVAAFVGRSVTGGRLDAAGALAAVGVPAAPTTPPVASAPAGAPSTTTPATAPAVTPSPTATAPGAHARANPVADLRLAVSKRTATVRLQLRREAEVQLAVVGRRSARHRTYRLGAGRRTVRLQRLRPGAYRLTARVGGTRVVRRFTVR